MVVRRRDRLWRAVDVRCRQCGHSAKLHSLHRASWKAIRETGLEVDMEKSAAWLAAKDDVERNEAALACLRPRWMTSMRELRAKVRR